MFGEIWAEIINRRADAMAIVQASGGITFSDLDRRARLMLPSTEGVVEARGDAIELGVAVVGAWLAGRPVQIVERDRTRRIAATPLPPGTALIKQTVGASGVRRCQFFTFDQILADVARLHDALGLGAVDAVVAPISLAHSFGLTTGLLQMVLRGVTLHWLDLPFPAAVQEAVWAHNRICLCGVPAVWGAWALGGVDLSSVAVAVSAGSRLPLALEQTLRQRAGICLHNLYGTSETGAVALLGPETLREDEACVGRFLPGVTGELRGGRLLVKSDAVGLGYDMDLPGEIFANGHHLTWDTAEIHSHGLKITGSLGAGINVAGRKLSPTEVAEKIQAATGGVGCTVRGAPSRDALRGQEVVATVDLPAAELTSHFRAIACAALQPWEVPRRWESSSTLE